MEENLLDIMAENRILYMDSILSKCGILIGSHDTKRIYNECHGNVNRMKLAIAYQFSIYRCSIYILW